MICRTQSLQRLLRMVVAASLTLGLLAPASAASEQRNKSSKAASSQQAKKAKKTERPAATAKVKAGKDVKAAKASARDKASAKAAITSAKKRQQLAQKRGKTVRAERIASGHRKGDRRVAARDGRQHRVAAHQRSVVRVAEAPRLSAGERLGLRASHDPLDLSSSVALVVDQETSEVLFSKNDTAVLPIASLTKLMTGLVIADANLPLDEMITITQEDADVYRTSRLAVGTTLSRGELMHLSLMSSENRAANALGRTFPGGQAQFVRRMNAKALELGMVDTRYVEPTGLSSQNQSSARDLATLVSVAYERPILRDLSTTPSHQLDLGRRTLQYNNSNRLIRDPEWDIGLQKTGYISEAGRCLVMQARVAGRQLIMVFLDSAGKLSRAQDAERVRRWVEAQSIQQQFARPQG